MHTGESIQGYLNNIITEDSETEISEVYTELSAKEIMPITLKFRDEKIDKEQDLEVLKLVEKEKKLIISGDSGSGKTTTLKWLNFIYATNCLEKKEEYIPLYIELNSYTRGSFYDYVKIKAKEKGISEDLKVILEGKVIILLDGLDLLSPTDNFFPYDEISNFISEYSNCRFVISSRPGFFESIKGGFKVSKLDKLTDEKIQIFIEKYVPDRELSAILINKILSDQRLKSLLTSPMLLYLAIKIAMDRKGNKEDLLPSNRSEMYEVFISGLFSHYMKTKGKNFCADRVQIENSLNDLFFQLQCWNKVSCEYSKALEIIKKHAEDSKFEKVTSQCILRDCFKLGFLIRKDLDIEYGIHQSFQEYFAAIKLKELFEKGFDISAVFCHPKWEKVVIFTSEIVEPIDEFIDLIISKGELFLASKCANKASDVTKRKLCVLLATKLDSKYELERIKCVESLGRIGVFGPNMIVKALEDKNELIQMSVVKALGNIESETAIKQLIDRLKDEHLFDEANKALKNFKSKEAEKSLYNTINDIDIETDFQLKLLIDEINYEERDVDWDFRNIALERLGNIRSEKVVEPLLNLLKDENIKSDIKYEAIKALGNIGSEKAVQPLIDILKDTDKHNEYLATKIKEAKEAFENLRSEEAVQQLIDILRGTDKHYEYLAAKNKEAKEAFKNLRSEEALQLLMDNTDKHYEYLATKIKEAKQGFENIETVEALQPLIDILKDTNEYDEYLAEKIKDEAIYAINSFELYEEALYPAYVILDDVNEYLERKKQYEYLRKSAAHALKKICTIKFKQQLEDLLKLKDELLVNTAFETLNRINVEEKSKIILFENGFVKYTVLTPKYSIFVSSVQKELENERLIIQDLVKKDSNLSACYSTLLYDFEPASPEKSLDGCLSALNTCQVYLLIVGVQYGNLVGEISITHTEYRHAKKRKLPILAFIKGEKWITREQGTEELLKELYSDNFKYKRFRNVIELRNEVQSSLEKLLQEDKKFLKI